MADKRFYYGVLAGSDNSVIYRSLVSNLYPYYFEDSLAGNSKFGDGSFFNIPFSKDDLNSISSFGGGIMKEVIINYDEALPEQLNTSSFFAGGILKVVIKNYDDWPAEQLNSISSFGGGELNVVVVPYDNWEPEQINASAIFSGGSMG